MNNRTEVIELIKKIKDQANRATMVQDRSVGIIKQACGYIFSECVQVIDLLKEQPLALNPCPFPPCKGKGKLQQNAGIYYIYCMICGRHTDSFETGTDAIKAWNDTNKAEQPSEFTKEARESIYLCSLCDMRARTADERRLIKVGYSLCDRLDRSESSRKELLDALEEIEAVSCGEKQVANDDSEGMGWIYKRIQAIAKAKKEGGE